MGKEVLFQVGRKVVVEDEGEREGRGVITGLCELLLFRKGGGGQGRTRSSFHKYTEGS